MCTFPLVKAFCRESYNQPRAVYAKLDAAEALRSRSDFFLSEEVTCTLPGGTGLHVGVYDVTERDHAGEAAEPAATAQPPSHGRNTACATACCQPRYLSSRSAADIRGSNRRSPDQPAASVSVSGYKPAAMPARYAAPRAVVSR